MNEHRRVQLRGFTSWDTGRGTRQLAVAEGFRGYFSRLEPSRRRKAHPCPVGGELTYDYWYNHDTGKQGDTKLCAEHEVQLV